MAGVQLSRWTLAYFVAAFIFLIAAEILLLLGFGFPNHGLRAPETLVLVHLVAVGWLTLLLCGALFQFLPVLIGSPLRQTWAVLPALGLLVSGLLALVTGFLQLGQYFESPLPFLLFGATLICVGVLTALYSLIATLVQVRPVKLPIRFVLLGLVALLITASLGWIFTFVLSGLDIGGTFFPLIDHAIPLHAFLGIGGWLSLTAIGVTHRLLPMFMLAPEKQAGVAYAGWWSGLATILLVLAALVDIYIGALDTGFFVTLALAGCTIVTATYIPVAVGYFRHRKRRTLEMNSKMAGLAIIFLALAIVVLCICASLGWPERGIASGIFIAAFGWLGGLGLSQAYKIVPFLTWLECYGTLMGRTPTPRVQDLVNERAVAPWFYLYFAGVSSGAAAIALDGSTWARISFTAMLIGTLGIVHQIYRARLLLNVPPQRQPAGVRSPHLFIIIPPRI